MCTQHRNVDTEKMLLARRKNIAARKQIRSSSSDFLETDIYIEQHTVAPQTDTSTANKTLRNLRLCSRAVVMRLRGLCIAYALSVRNLSKDLCARYLCSLFDRASVHLASPALVCDCMCRVCLYMVGSLCVLLMIYREWL